MGRKFVIDTLPPEVRQFLDECLQNPALTHHAVTEEVNHFLVEELGLQPVITWRIVQRHDANTKKTKEELKKHKVIARELVRHIGDVSLNDIQKGVAAMTGNLVVGVINGLNQESLGLKEAKDLVSISRTMTETAAINFDLELKAGGTR